MRRVNEVPPGSRFGRCATVIGRCLMGYAVCCLLAGCQRPPELFRIALIDWPGFYPILLAEQNGYFAQQGIKAKVFLEKGNPEANELFEKGQVDAVAGVFTDFLLMEAQGIPLRVVYVTDYSVSADVIVARKQVESISALEGRRISVDSLNSFSHLFVLKSLERAGLREHQFRLALVPYNEVPKALKEGRIDAGHTWDPHSGLALADGGSVVAGAGDIPGIITEVIAFREDFIATRRKTALGALRAIMSSQREFIERPEPGLARVAPLIGRRVEELDGFLKQMALVPPDRQERLFDGRNPSPHSLMALGNTVLGFLDEHGQLSHPPRVREALDGSLVREALRPPP